MTRKNIYLTDDTRALLGTVATRYHGGNESAAIAAALAHHLERPALLRQAILDLAAAIEPDERYDPSDDPRTIAPTLRLMALLDAQAASAIGDALNELWVRWSLRHE